MVKTTDVVDLGPEGNEIFDDDYEALVSHYTKYTSDPGNLEKILMGYKRGMKQLAMKAKLEIQPAAGGFYGMNAMTGFGMQMIRPDHLVPAAQGRTFDANLSGLTANSWYGYLHNGAIGAAYDPTPLYLRKELGVAIAGFVNTGDAIVDELQFEIRGKPLPVWNMLTQMRGADDNIFLLPKVLWLDPAIQYRSQFKINSTGGSMSLIPIGITFARAEWMQGTAITQPSTTAP